MKKHIETKESGLQCDNPSCDWVDKTITFDTCKDWINKPCPKCGENVLTYDDFLRAEELRKYVDLINSMSLDEIKEMNKLNGFIENEEDAQVASITISTHKEIKIENITFIDKDEKTTEEQTSKET